MELIYALSQIIFFLLNAIFIAAPLFFLFWFEQKIKNHFLIPLYVLIPFITLGTGLFLLTKISPLLDGNSESSVPIILGIFALWNGIPFLAGKIVGKRIFLTKQVGVNNG